MRFTRLPIGVYFFTMIALTIYQNKLEAQIEVDSVFIDSIEMSYDFDEFIVTAQYAPTHVNNAIQSIRKINRKEIAQFGVTNLEQLLAQDLSIRIQQDMLLGSSMKLQGVEGENVKIMVDGIPIIGRLDGNIDLGQINLDNVVSVEIIEGPMSVNYGSDALGGVINLITKKSQIPKSELGLGQQFETRGENRTMVSAGHRFSEDWLFRLNIGRDVFNGVKSDTLRSQLWNPKTQFYGDFSLRRNFQEDHQIHLTYALFDEVIDNLGAKRRPQFKPYAFDEYFNTKRQNFALLHEGTVGSNFYLQSNAGISYFKRYVDHFRYEFDTQEESLTESDTTSFINYMTRSVLASKFQQSQIQFQVGLDLDHEIGMGAKIVDIQTDSLRSASITDLAVFSSIRYQPISRLVFETGLRFIYNSDYKAPLVPSFNTKYEITKNLMLRASYAKGYRSPSLKELYLSFIDINHNIIGNPTLKAETSNNFQVNLRYSTALQNTPIQINTQLFYNSIVDQISLYAYEEVNGEIIPSIGSSTNNYTYFNLDKAILKGASMRILVKNVQSTFEAGIAKLGYFNPLSEQIDNISRFTYATELSAKGTYNLKRTKTQVSLICRYNDLFISYFPELENENIVGLQRHQDGYSMLDATIIQPFLNNRLTITTGVRNLLDVQSVNVSTSGGNVIISEQMLPVSLGRSYFAQINLKLSRQ